MHVRIHEQPDSCKGNATTTTLKLNAMLDHADHRTVVDARRHMPVKEFVASCVIAECNICDGEHDGVSNFELPLKLSLHYLPLTVPPPPSPPSAK